MKNHRKSTIAGRMSLAPSLSLAMALALGAMALVACGSGKNSEKASKSSDKTSKAGEMTGAAEGMKTASRVAPKARPKPKVVPLVEHGLDSADAKWKGWIVTGPKNAKVMKDGYKGARLAADGKGMMSRKIGDDQGFDIAFKQSKKPLKGFAKVKKLLDLKVKYSKGKMSYKILKEEADVITWSQQRGKYKSFFLEVHLKVGGKDVLCKTNHMIGAGNEAELARYLTACRTLKKK